MQNVTSLFLLSAFSSSAVKALKDAFRCARENVPRAREDAFFCVLMRRGGDQRCAHRDDKASRDGFIFSFGKKNVMKMRVATQTHNKHKNLGDFEMKSVCVL
jgi:DNA relaxase NicK